MALFTIDLVSKQLYRKCMFQHFIQVFW